MLINIKRGFTLAEVAIVIAIFVVMVMALTPFVRMIKARALDIACTNNLKLISLGLHEFAADTNGFFPRNLSELYPKYVKDPKTFDCPASKDTGTPEKPDYEYIAGLTERSPQSEAIVVDLSGGHRNRGKIVLTVGGAVAKR